MAEGHVVPEPGRCEQAAMTFVQDLLQAAMLLHDDEEEQEGDKPYAWEVESLVEMKPVAQPFPPIGNVLCASPYASEVLPPEGKPRHRKSKMMKQGDGRRTYCFGPGLEVPSPPPLKHHPAQPPPPPLVQAKVPNYYVRPMPMPDWMLREAHIVEANQRILPPTGPPTFSQGLSQRRGPTSSPRVPGWLDRPSWDLEMYNERPTPRRGHKHHSRSRDNDPLANFQQGHQFGARRLQLGDGYAFAGSNGPPNLPELAGEDEFRAWRVQAVSNALRLARMRDVPLRLPPQMGSPAK